MLLPIPEDLRKGVSDEVPDGCENVNFDPLEFAPLAALAGVAPRGHAYVTDGLAICKPLTSFTNSSFESIPWSSNCLNVCI